MQNGVIQAKKKAVMTNIFDDTFLSGLNKILLVNSTTTPYLPISLVASYMVCPILTQITIIRIRGRTKAMVPCQSTQVVCKVNEGKWRSLTLWVAKVQMFWQPSANSACPKRSGSGGMRATSQQLPIHKSMLFLLFLFCSVKERGRLMARRRSMLSPENRLENVFFFFWRNV